MTLITILLCLALQRFVNLGGWFQPSWFAFYLKSLNPWLAKCNAWVALLLIIAPILILLALLHVICAGKLFGLLDLLLATIVLFFCIDARDCNNQLTGYFTNLEKGDTQAAANSVADFIGTTNTKSELIRTVTKAVLQHSFTQLFVGLFWFMVFGIYGVTVYFLITLLRSTPNTFTKLAGQIQDILDWIPAKLLGISYALAGNFGKGFSYWRKNLWTRLTEIRKFAVAVGIAALDAESNATKAVPQENHAVLDLINHVLIIWLVVFTLVLLGIWL